MLHTFYHSNIFFYSNISFSLFPSQPVFSGQPTDIRHFVGLMPAPYHNYQLLMSPFECSTCGKFYKYKTSLNKHIKYECNKEPLFLCPICKKRFFQKIHLKKHLLSSVHRKKPAGMPLDGDK